MFNGVGSWPEDTRRAIQERYADKPRWYILGLVPCLNWRGTKSRKLVAKKAESLVGVAQPVWPVQRILLDWSLAYLTAPKRKRLNDGS